MERLARITTEAKFMRQKMITLDPTSWEIASKKKNFSGWVRAKLKEEAAMIAEKTENLPEWWAYCEPCDLSASHTNRWLVEHKYCPKCYNNMDFKGMVE